jgi:hypothetical protein
MLAKRRQLKLNGDEIQRTPLLVPSFSSKGFANVEKIIGYTSESIEAAMLISAHDLHYGQIKPPFDFAETIFLDSGGYEASRDADLSDFGERDYIPQRWTQEMHEAQLAQWASAVPTVIISYDHPKERLPFQEQIDRAKKMAYGRKDVMREILLKPETEAQRFLKIDRIVQNADSLAEFDVIGATEKELGRSVIERMKNIATLRMALEKLGIDKPLHVFGSLDTVSTPLYFLAGADIFDGLTWLRFAFHNGQTLYKQNFASSILGVSTRADQIDGFCWNRNYSYLKEMELEMRGFLKGNDFDAFRYHRDLFRDVLRNVMEAVEG